MKYHVYLSAPSHVLELQIESDTPPEYPSSYGQLAPVRIGNSIFPLGQFIAVVPSDELKNRSITAGGK
jgi:hypothetical protein